MRGSGTTRSGGARRVAESLKIAPVAVELDVEGTAAVDVVGELGNGRLGLLDGSELNDADTLGAAALEEDLCLVDFARRLEELDEVLVGS